MAYDGELMLLFGVVHLIGLGLAGALLVMLLRADSNVHRPPPREDDGGGGGEPRPEPAKPTRPDGGGLPLPNATPARTRLREPARLADVVPKPARRPAHDPSPSRTPAHH
ncbi:MAG: hypothetical protein QOF17_897 [Solirubrobacteraceae bacterium]|jgi:hypothetical protein|nr:hypothetical protein [Solirubrobacteraceae bacterium]